MASKISAGSYLRHYLNAWYPLPDIIPNDLNLLVFQFAFDPLMNKHAAPGNSWRGYSQFDSAYSTGEIVGSVWHGCRFWSNRDVLSL